MAIEGTVKANPEIFGETLDTEQMKGETWIDIFCYDSCSA